MKKLSVVKTVLFCLVALFALPSQAALITFEELGTKQCCFASEPALTNQYAASGVNFSGGWEVLNQSGGFGVNAVSGQHFAAFNTSVSGITNTLTMLFDDLVSTVSGYLGAGASSTWTVSAFKSGSLVSQSLVVNAGNSYVSFDLSGILADTLTISSSNRSGVLDNLSFDRVTTPALVSEPSTVALIGLGLLGLGLLRRKHG